MQGGETGQILMANKLSAHVRMTVREKRMGGTRRGEERECVCQRKTNENETR